MTGKLLFAILAAAVLAACDGAPSADERAAARRQALADTDPAAVAALADPIMSDRDLSVADDSLRVRHVGGPAVVAVPPRSRANAKMLAALDGLRPAFACETGFSSDLAWLAKLPPTFAPYPGATAIEASGIDEAVCRVRVASFDAAATAWTILRHYRGRATEAGYATQLKRRGADHVLTGSRGRASFYMIVSPRTKASAVSVLTSEPVR